MLPNGSTQERWLQDTLVGVNRSVSTLSLDSSVFTFSVNEESAVVGQENSVSGGYGTAEVPPFDRLSAFSRAQALFSPRR